MDLSGTWRAVEANDELRRVFAEPELDDQMWAEVPVPGHWRSQPDFAATDGPLLYRRHFVTERPEDKDRRAWLSLEGVFYQGDVWLDRSYLGDTEGYFAPHAFEITGTWLQRTEHLLAIEVTCSRPADLTAKRNLTGVFQHWDCLDRDWNPGGIWQPVRIDETGPVRIEAMRVLCPDATADLAVLDIQATLDAAQACTVSLDTTVHRTSDEDSPPGALVAERRVEQPLAAGANRVTWRVAVEQPVLWWPHALGDQALHDVSVEVVQGQVSDRRLVRTGLRQVRMKNFTATINGERLYLKGANQGPTRLALGEATPAEFERDVALARQAGLDLLRVHGHISRQELYDAADRQGLLIWQDLPLQWGYAGVRRQAVRQAREAVDLLGHHPCIALWCGHNEPLAVAIGPEALDGTSRPASRPASRPSSQPASRSARRRAPQRASDPTQGPAQASRGAPEESRPGRLPARVLARFAVGQTLPTWNKTVLDRSIRRALEKADGSRPVVAHSGILPHPAWGTDSHLYFGWYHGDERDFPSTLARFPVLARFVSEFGAQAVPDNAGFCQPDRWPDLDWPHLARAHALQKAVFDRYVAPADYPTFEAWRNATQTYQAEVIRYHIETLRRLKYRPSGGFCQFCFADSQPAVSWSVLDHERAPKAGYEALAAACAPVIVVADRPAPYYSEGDTITLDIHVVSDLRVPLGPARLRAYLSWPGGDATWWFGGYIDADCCLRIGTLSAELAGRARGPLTLELDLDWPAGKAHNRYDSVVWPNPE